MVRSINDQFATLGTLTVSVFHLYSWSPELRLMVLSCGQVKCCTGSILFTQMDPDVSSLQNS